MSGLLWLGDVMVRESGSKLGGHVLKLSIMLLPGNHQWLFCVAAGGAITSPVFGFAPPVWHDATKIVTMSTLLCRSKRLRIRNLLAT